MEGLQGFQVDDVVFVCDIYCEEEPGSVVADELGMKDEDILRDASAVLVQFIYSTPYCLLSHNINILWRIGMPGMGSIIIADDHITDLKLIHRLY